MPKRSNPFQRLVYLIQRQLAGKATVTESKMLVNVRTDTPTEVDVVIETEVAGVPLVVSVECTSEGRKATIEWVREMIGKHDDLPTNKLVLVSKSGFTRPAKKLAEARGVDIKTLTEAQRFPWAELPTSLVDSQNLRIASIEFRDVSWRMAFHEMDKDQSPAHGPLHFDNEAPIFSKDGTLKGTVAQLAAHLRSHRPTVVGILQRWIREKKDRFTITWTATEGVTVADVEGRRYPMKDFSLNIRLIAVEVPVTLKAATFGPAQLAYGTVPDIFSGKGSEVSILFSETEGETPKAALSFSSDSGFGKQVFDAVAPEAADDSS